MIILKQVRPAKNRKFPRIFFNLFLLFVLSLQVLFAQQDLTPIVEKVSESVVVVYSLDSRGKISGQGTGFLVTKGRIVTNRHVIDGAFAIKIKTKVGNIYSVTHVLAPNRNLDLACLFIRNAEERIKSLIPKSTAPKLGENILVIGNPLGLEQTVSNGIISAIRELKGFGKVYQLTAPISRGSSGSPVVDMKGEVLGVVTFYMQGGQNLNFAIPIGLALAFNERNKQTVYKWSLENPAKSSQPQYGSRKQKDNRYKRSGLVKKSRSGICHDSSSRWYRRTKHYKAFDSIQDCLGSGGRLPKR
jgi:S1-C subfamily serine protease